MQGLHAKSDSNLSRSPFKLNQLNSLTRDSVNSEMAASGYSNPLQASAAGSTTSRRQSRDYLLGNFSRTNGQIFSGPEEIRLAVNPCASQSLPSGLDSRSTVIELLPPPEHSSLLHWIQRKLKLVPWFVWIYILVVLTITILTIWNYKSVLAWLHSVSSTLLDMGFPYASFYYFYL